MLLCHAMRAGLTRFNSQLGVCAGISDIEHSCSRLSDLGKAGDRCARLRHP